MLNEFDPTKAQRDQGLYRKYNVSRVDGSDALGERNENAQYFVMEITNDAFARTAVLAYADACELLYPLLAADMRAAVERCTSSR